MASFGVCVFLLNPPPAIDIVLVGDPHSPAQSRDISGFVGGSCAGRVGESVTLPRRRGIFWGSRRKFPCASGRVRHTHRAATGYFGVWVLGRKFASASGRVRRSPTHPQNIFRIGVWGNVIMGAWASQTLPRAAAEYFGVWGSGGSFPARVDE